tara:strand:+ start:1139 stop:1303 length:165 start_codon:yes stop_codon:yes gene_type:complete
MIFEVLCISGAYATVAGILIKVGECLLHTGPIKGRYMAISTNDEDVELMSDYTN